MTTEIDIRAMKKAALERLSGFDLDALKKELATHQEAAREAAAEFEQRFGTPLDHYQAPTAAQVAELIEAETECEITAKQLDGNVRALIEAQVYWRVQQYRRYLHHRIQAQAVKERIEKGYGRDALQETKYERAHRKLNDAFDGSVAAKYGTEMIEAYDRIGRPLGRDWQPLWDELDSEGVEWRESRRRTVGRKIEDAGETWERGDADSFIAVLKGLAGL